jgi:hypothetical protein
LEQSLGKIAQAKERKHKHTTFNCIHWIDDWLQSHPCKKLVEFTNPNSIVNCHECHQVLTASKPLSCHGQSQQKGQPPILAFKQVE